MYIVKHCLTATDFPSDPGAHKIGQGLKTKLPVGSQPTQLAGTCSKQENCVGPRNKARMVTQAASSGQTASHY